MVSVFDTRELHLAHIIVVRAMFTWQAVSFLEVVFALLYSREVLLSPFSQSRPVLRLVIISDCNSRSSAVNLHTTELIPVCCEVITEEVGHVVKKLTDAFGLVDD